MDKKVKFINKIRLAVQSLWTFISNSFLTGFTQGKIYQGSLKKFCLPGLNCYSCPGALGSCPIGAIQATLGSEKKAAFFVSGMLIFIGAIVGRGVCGWLCPFGLFQDLLNKIPFFKKISTFKGDKLLRKLKYVILLVFVIILPLFFLDPYGISTPYFCKYICPNGVLQGAIPLSIANETIREALGFLFTYKSIILAVTVLLSVIIYRPFCKYICPLGAIYSLFNRFSILKITNEKSKCINCKKCEKSCKMNVDILKNPNSAECIRCGACVSACPTESLEMKFSVKSDVKLNKKIEKESNL